MNYKKHKLFFKLIYTFLLFTLFCGVMNILGCVVNSNSSTSARDTYVINDSGIGQITLTWRNSPGVDSYNLYISKIPGAKNNGERISNVANPITISALEIGTTYYFVVTAINNGLESEPSSEVKYVSGE